MYSAAAGSEDDRATELEFLLVSDIMPGCMKWRICGVSTSGSIMMRMWDPSSVDDVLNDGADAASVCHCQFNTNELHE